MKKEIISWSRYLPIEMVNYLGKNGFRMKPVLPLGSPLCGVQWVRVYPC